MDDLRLRGGDIAVLEKLKKKLRSRFKMIDMGYVSLVLGREVTRDDDLRTPLVSLENYTNTVLVRFGMSEFNPLSTPGDGADPSPEHREEDLQNEITVFTRLQARQCTSPKRSPKTACTSSAR